MWERLWEMFLKEKAAGFPRSKYLWDEKYLEFWYSLYSLLIVFYV